MAKITRKELNLRKKRVSKKRLSFDEDRNLIKAEKDGHGWSRKAEEKSIGHQQVYHTEDWKKLRKEALQIQPLCEVCLAEGRVQEAQEVDHMVPISVAPEKAFEIDNLWPLCKSHHARKTRLEQTTPDLHTKGIHYWGRTLTKKQ